MLPLQYLGSIDQLFKLVIHPQTMIFLVALAGESLDLSDGKFKQWKWHVPNFPPELAIEVP